MGDRARIDAAKRQVDQDPDLVISFPRHAGQWIAVIARSDTSWRGYHIDLQQSYAEFFVRLSKTRAESLPTPSPSLNPMGGLEHLGLVQHVAPSRPGRRRLESRYRITERGKLAAEPVRRALVLARLGAT